MLLLLPYTVEAVEIVWTGLNALATAGCWVAWRWARNDLRYVESSSRQRLARHFREDVRNARGRFGLAVAMTATGVLAMTFDTPSRTPAQWMIVGLLHAAPVYLLWRCVSEATSRRATVNEVARERQNGGGA